MEKVNDNMDSLPEGYIKHLEENRKFIETLAKEELIEERRDNLDNLKNRMVLDIRQTEIAKNRFINELKNSGLGERIKAAPNEVEIIKRPLPVRIWRRIRKFFNL
jgi:hypothetical protein